MGRAFIFIFLMGFIVSPAFTQSRVDTTFSADFLVQEILIDQGILAGNVEYRGADHAIGFFQDASKQLNIEEGVLLTTGNVLFSLGPNSTPRSGWASNLEGDKDLDKVTRGVTHDAAVLEFDFIATSEVVSFEYVFASEEYMEYVGSKFNDVFGFFLSGPGIEDTVNLARLEDGTPITINNINTKENSEYYIDNPVYNNHEAYIWDVRKRQVVRNKKFGKKVKDPVYETQFDGFTVVLEANHTVIPNEVYHIKMAIADVSDGILDSGVILKGQSFKSTGDLLVEIDKSFEKDYFLEEKIETDLVSHEEQTDLSIPLQIMNVEFEFDKYYITESSFSTIHNVYQILLSDPTLVVEVVGHTDNYGSTAYNNKLSEFRSNSVVNHLVKLGVERTRIIKEFYGEDLPIELNNTDNGRAKNRRVEFRIVKKS